MFDPIKTSIASILLVISGYFNSNLLPHDDSLTQRQPEVSMVTIAPSLTTKPTAKPKVKVGATTNNNNTGGKIDCVGPDGKQFNEILKNTLIAL